MPFAVVILATFVAMPPLMTHPLLVMSESPCCMITITIVILTLRQGALYDAKSSGRHRVCVSTDALMPPVVARKARGEE
jgi:hypothetical protein